MCYNFKRPETMNNYVEEAMETDSGKDEENTVYEEFVPGCFFVLFDFKYCFYVQIHYTRCL